MVGQFGVNLVLDMAMLSLSKTILSLLLISLLGGALLAAEPLPVSNDYVLRVWNANDGLPDNNILGIEQTPDGYLWLATWSGLVRFDGARFTQFLKDGFGGLESKRVRTVFVDRDANLWLGLERGGVARKKGERFETIVPLQSRESQTAWTSSFAQDASGRVWFGRDPDLEIYNWFNGKLSHFSSSEGIGPGIAPHVQADREGRIWWATTQECGFFDGQRFQAIDRDGGLGVRMAFSKKGGMWAIRGKKLLRYHENGSWEVVADLSFLSGFYEVNTLYENPAGDLWIGTQTQGLVRYREGNFVRVPTSHSEVTSIREDREGNLWVGTQGGGLDRLRSRAFFLRQMKNGLNSDSIASLCEDVEGKLWLEGRAGTPVRAIDSSNQLFATPPNWIEGVVGTAIYAICPDPEGGIWMAGLGGLMHWQNGVFRRETYREPATALLVDSKGNLWVATTSKGLTRWKDGKEEEITQKNGLIEIRALAEDTKGQIWAGTEGGLLFQHKEDQFVPIQLSAAKSDEPIRFIVPDQNGTLWIGSFQGGLYRWRDGKVTRLASDAGLPVDDLRSLLIEDNGNFWIGTGRGLFRVARSELDASLDQGTSLIGVISYGEADGLPSMEFSFGFRNATAKTQDGHLWFATTYGALEIDPKVLGKTLLPVNLLIEDVRVGGTSLSFAGRGGFILPSHPGTIEIRYTLPQLSAPEQIDFQYRLLGLSKDWTKAGNQRTAFFPQLPPGDYSFEVMAREKMGALLPPIRLNFTVRAAWWETLWFRWGAGLLGAVLLAITVRWVVKRRMQARIRMLEQEHAVELERSRIARDMHDELGASLTQINITSQLLKFDPPEARVGHIEEIASTARRTIASLDEIVWAVNPRHDTLPSLSEYLGQYAVDFLASSGVSCEVDMPGELPQCPLSAPVRHHLFLMVKEALNNVVKHSGASAVLLKAEFSGRALRFTVTDNGSGFETGSESMHSNGLRNMRERMTEIAGTFRIESSLGKGTSYIFELPLPAGSV